MNDIKSTKIECPFCNSYYSKDDSKHFAESLIYIKDMGDSHSHIQTKDNIYYYHPNNFSQTGFDISKLNAVDKKILTNIINAHKESLMLCIGHCPACGNFDIYIKRVGSQFKKSNDIIPISPLVPIGRVNKYRKYVPKYIFKDYVEAYQILHLSPQSSATLSRRILEEIIENYFEITSGRLIDKINKLGETHKLDNNTIDTLHSLRQIGNIGAHMEKKSDEIIRLDNPEEANILLKMIEILFNHTYVSSKENNKTEEIVQKIKDKYKSSNR